MIFKVSVSTIYECSLERAFKTPLLCDVSKIHTGYGFMPKITHCTNDEDWGQIGSHKKVYAAKSLTQKGGFVSVDRIIDRIENKYWKFQVDDFQSWMLGFTKFVGEWETTEIEPHKILVRYTYTLYSETILLYPLNLLFAKTFWHVYMKRVLEIVKTLAYNNEPYIYN
jgi:hypothetical protein